jgi:hypothetical protein
VITGIAHVRGEDADGVLYHGHRPSAGGSVITVETAKGVVLGLLHHHVLHSPSGFAWGYEGSGAAETARCLLLAALDTPSCPDCAGHGLTVLGEDGERPFDPDVDDPLEPAVLACMACDRDGLRAVPYQQFKTQVVAVWSGEWWISRAEVRGWLAEHGLTP